jgi:16S rRNA processing protein RimM
LDHIVIGKILKPHGIRGELKILPLTADPARFYDLDHVFVKRGEDVEKVAVDEVHLTADGKLFMYLDGVNNRDDAELMRNLELLIEEKDAIDLPEDTYFHFQLLGMQVYDITTETNLGEVIEIVESGGNDIYLVQGIDKVYQIPARKAFIHKVDVANKRMDVQSIPGLLDI